MFHPSSAVDWLGFDAGSVFRLPLLLDGLHALGHGRRGAADGIRDVKVLERLLADVERSAARLRFHRFGQLNGLGKVVGLLDITVARQVGSHFGQTAPHFAQFVVRQFGANDLLFFSPRCVPINAHQNNRRTMLMTASFQERPRRVTIAEYCNLSLKLGTRMLTGVMLSLL